MNEKEGIPLIKLEVKCVEHEGKIAFELDQKFCNLGIDALAELFEMADKSAFKKQIVEYGKEFGQKFSDTVDEFAGTLKGRMN